MHAHIASSARFYHEKVHADMTAEPATVPLGLVTFADTSIRRFVDRDHKNVVWWHGYTVEGHHVPRQATDVLVADLRGFCGDLRAGTP